jgi:hypothetical protein
VSDVWWAGGFSLEADERQPANDQDGRGDTRPPQRLLEDENGDDGAAPTAIKVVVENGSRPTLMSAFHPAWHAAANRTATKTKFCTSKPYTGTAASAIEDELASRQAWYSKFQLCKPRRLFRRGRDSGVAARYRLPTRGIVLQPQKRYRQQIEEGRRQRCAVPPMGSTSLDRLTTLRFGR